MYQGSTGIIEHYINPIIGTMKLTDITARVLEKYYMSLLKTPAVAKATDKKYSKEVKYVTPQTVRKVHNILRSSFHQAVKCELMEKNPAIYATVPKSEPKERDIWDCVDVSEEEIESNSAFLYVNKELQRITKEAIRVLDGKDVLLVILEESKRCKTVRILKLPKTESSVRKVFLRHTSVTYKLKLNGGDIKAVQGDGGHSQINMVTDVYSHIIDDWIYS